ncbi:histidine ammonia-lyase [Streptomyces sp. NPDC051554]|uniref:histidine ammonia-lyase n=1 Tax=Streptomyces sp. NPDC051554 TaxID=3365656 RepID=UPI00379AB4CD
MSTALLAALPITTDAPLTTAALERAADGPVEIQIEAGVRERVAACHEFALRRIQDGRPVYGATTGFGPLVTFRGRDSAADQCDNALAHLSAGQGPDLEPATVRGAMLVRLTSLCRGHSGVSLPVVEALAAALGTTFAPAVPRLGSLGASGDLIPLSYVARALRGEGLAYVNGERLPAADALSLAGLTPVELDGRDALALVNGTSLTAAAAGLAAASLVRSRSAAVALSALLTDVLGAEPAFLVPELLEAFGHPEAALVGAELRDRLDGVVPSGTRPLQEPYTVRCTPQLIGAATSALEYAGQVVERDLNSVSDNPLFFPDRDLVAHGGNFFGQPAAFSCDLLSLAATQLGNLAERQLDLLIDPHRNGGLAPMLSTDPGRQHALQGVQLAATAIVAAMRRGAHPASVQSLPTNLHNQDVIPFGTQAALNALETARLLRLLHGSLAVALRQAAYLTHRPLSRHGSALVDQIAEVSAPVEHDRPLDEEVRQAASVLDRLAEQV